VEEQDGDIVGRVDALSVVWQSFAAVAPDTTRPRTVVDGQIV